MFQPTSSCSQVNGQRLPSLGLRHLLLVVAFGLTGCPSATAPPTTPATKATTSGPLRVIVLDDVALAEVIEREWRARSDTGFEIDHQASRPLLEETPQKLDADIVIFPTGMLGQLAEAKLIRALPTNLIEQPEYRKLEIFDLVRRREMNWGEKPYAVSFGSPTAVLLVRPDRCAEDAWKTWETLSSHTRATSNPPTISPLVQPLGPGWAGRVLLMRAVTYIFDRSSVSTFFDFRSLQPRINTPPFARALEELVSDYRAGPPEAIEFSPADALNHFLQGKSAIALTWPSTVPDVSGEMTLVDFPLTIRSLPGATERFDFGDGNWVAHDDGQVQRVTLFGISGRLGAITRYTRNLALATTFLGWATGPDQSGSISMRSAATAPFRDSHVAQAAGWIDRRIPRELEKQYADVVQQSLDRAESIGVPRLPGQDHYLRVLDDAVHQALRGEASATEVLESAAAKWKTITAELGHDAQLRAYRRSLGIE